MPKRIDRNMRKVVFCLAGINTADLYYMEKENLRDGKMCYCRRKTTNRRDDKAYIEIAVPDRLSHLLEKYEEGRFFLLYHLFPRLYIY